MKKLYFILIGFFVFCGVDAQIVNIPDANFKAKLLSSSSSNQIASTDTPDSNGNVSTYAQIDTNNNGEIEVSEAAAIQWLSVDNTSIIDLTGIESFTQLQFLDCRNNLLSSLDGSGLTNLHYLRCTSNQLTSLNVSNLNNLQTLECSNNQLPSLNVINFTNLQILDCSGNQIPSLDVSGLINLQSLNCDTNQITSLDVSGLTNLHYLNCENNQIPSLSVSGLTNLHSLFFSNNLISSINLSGLINLQVLICNNNQLPSLNLSGLTNLTNVQCGNNQLPNIDISGLTLLQYLFCPANQLSSLNVVGLTNLQSINCSSNQIANLDLSGLTNLQLLDCSNNQLTSINVVALSNLQSLKCQGNQLQNLNAAGLTNLQLIYCRGNQLTSISTSGLTNLLYLYVGQNQLTNLNVNGLTNLQTIDAEYNLITNLDLSGLTNLNYVNVYSNQLTNINLSGLTNLQTLICGLNLLPSIDVNGLTNLQLLDCIYNQLNTLDASGLTNLQTLYCYYNQLTSINVSGLTNLQTLVCAYNQLTSLDLNGLTSFQALDTTSNQLNSLFIKNGNNEQELIFPGNPNLEYICADDGQVASIQTQITGYGYTNCHVNSYCSFTPGGAFYTIQGNNHYDSNADGCDSSDINYPNLKLSFSDGTNICNLIPDTTGAYHYDVQAGTYTFAPVLENASYFNVSTTTTTVTFPTTTSPFIQDFCLTANGVYNDLEIAMLPIINANPGFDAHYKIIYKNKGTATQSGTVALTYNGTISSFVSAIPAVSLQATNNLSWSFIDLQPFETRTIDATLNINTPTATPPVNTGDILNYTATITGLTDETPSDNVTTLNQTALNSYDPNEKTCTEGTTVSPNMVGQYVHYIIHFENDGTANAQNIVVKDMIDTTKFDIGTLVPLTGSANFTTRITNTNQVEFIFQNINLPFATGTNGGYVAFKIKTKPTLVLGDTFSNTANIYFDYNAPIVTNTATTTIAALAKPEFAFSDYFTLSPIPTKGTLNINTKQDIIVSSISIYNTLGQVMLVTSDPSKTIDVSNLATGSYFIKVITDKGTSSGKFIKE